MPWQNYIWHPFVASKSTLVQLFKAAMRRLSDQPQEQIAELPAERIVSATEEMNKLADEVRDAHTQARKSS